MCTVDSVPSLLCCRNTTRARGQGKQHIYLLYVVCLLVHLFVIFRLCFSPLPGSGIFGDAICMCLFVCLLVCAGIMSLGTINKTDDAGKTFMVYEGSDGLKQGHCERTRAMQPFRHITVKDKGEYLSHCNLITFSFMNEKIKTPQHFHLALSINI